MQSHPCFPVTGDEIHFWPGNSHAFGASPQANAGVAALGSRSFSHAAPSQYLGHGIAYPAGQSGGATGTSQVSQHPSGYSYPVSTSYETTSAASFHNGQSQQSPTQPNQDMRAPAFMYGQGYVQPSGASMAAFLGGHGASTPWTAAPAVNSRPDTLNHRTNDAAGPALLRQQPARQPSWLNRSSLDIQSGEPPGRLLQDTTPDLAHRSDHTNAGEWRSDHKGEGGGRALGWPPRREDSTLAHPSAKFEFAMVLTGKAADCHKEHAIAVYLRRKGVVVDVCKYNGMVLLRLSAPEAILEHMGEITRAWVRLQEEHGGGWLAYQKELRHLYERTPLPGAELPKHRASRNMGKSQPAAPSSSHAAHPRAHMTPAQPDSHPEAAPIRAGGQVYDPREQVHAPQNRWHTANHDPSSRGTHPPLPGDGNHRQVELSGMCWAGAGAGGSRDYWPNGGTPPGQPWFSSSTPPGLTPPESESSGSSSTLSCFDGFDGLDGLDVPAWRQYVQSQPHLAPPSSWSPHGQAGVEVGVSASQGEASARWWHPAGIGAGHLGGSGHHTGSNSSADQAGYGDAQVSAAAGHGHSFMWDGRDSANGPGGSLGWVPRGVAGDGSVAELAGMVPGQGGSQGGYPALSEGAYATLSHDSMGGASNDGGEVGDNRGSGLEWGDGSGQEPQHPRSPLGEACFPEIPAAVVTPEIIPLLPRIWTGRAPRRQHRRASRLSDCSEGVAEGRAAEGNDEGEVSAGDDRGGDRGGGDRGFGGDWGGRAPRSSYDGVGLGDGGDGLVHGGWGGQPQNGGQVVSSGHGSVAGLSHSNGGGHEVDGIYQGGNIGDEHGRNQLDHHGSDNNKDVDCGTNHGRKDGGYGSNSHHKDDGTSVFSAAERQRLLYMRIINRAHGANLNILRLMKNGIVASDGFFALHDADWRQRILDKVRRDRRFPFSDQLGVVADIQFYCGERTAFYFAFQAFFICALMAPMLFGSLIYLLELMGVFAVSTLQPLYAILVSLWSTVAIELWERRMVSLRHEWGTQGFHHQEHPRPQFGWSKGCLDFNETKTRKNPITGEEEEYYPIWKFVAKQLLSAAFLGALIGGLVFLLYWIFAVRFPVDTSFRIGLDKRTLLEFLPVLIAYGLCMPVLNILWDKIAYRTNEWENWRTEAGFDNRLIVKCFSFILVNNFLAVFVVAFQHVSIKEAGVYPPSLVPKIRRALFAQVMVFMILQSLISEKGKVLVRQIYLSLMVWIRNCSLRAPSGIEEGEDPNSSARQRAKVARATVQNAWSETFKPDFDFRYEYGDLLSVIGFVMLFAILFPLSPLIAVVNIYIKIRVDIHNLMWGCRRPMPERAKSIGAWMLVLRLMATASVLTNITLDTVLNENLAHRSPERKFVYAVVVEHGLFALQYVIRQVMKRSPARLAEERMRQQRHIEQLVKEQKLSRKAADKAMLGNRGSMEEVMSPMAATMTSPVFSPAATRHGPFAVDASTNNCNNDSDDNSHYNYVDRGLALDATAGSFREQLVSPRAAAGVSRSGVSADYSPYVCSPSAPAPMESLRVHGRRPAVPVLSRNPSMLWQRGDGQVAPSQGHALWGDHPSTGGLVQRLKERIRAIS